MDNYLQFNNLYSEFNGYKNCQLPDYIFESDDLQVSEFEVVSSETVPPIGSEVVIEYDGVNTDDENSQESFSEFDRTIQGYISDEEDLAVLFTNDRYSSFLSGNKRVEQGLDELTILVQNGDFLTQSSPKEPAIHDDIHNPVKLKNESLRARYDNTADSVDNLVKNDLHNLEDSAEKQCSVEETVEKSDSVQCYPPLMEEPIGNTDVMVDHSVKLIKTETYEIIETENEPSQIAEVKHIKFHNIVTPMEKSNDSQCYPALVAEPSSSIVVIVDNTVETIKTETYEDIETDNEPSQLSESINFHVASIGKSDGAHPLDSPSENILNSSEISTCILINSQKNCEKLAVVNCLPDNIPNSESIIVEKQKKKLSVEDYKRKFPKKNYTPKPYIYEKVNDERSKKDTLKATQERNKEHLAKTSQKSPKKISLKIAQENTQKLSSIHQSPVLKNSLNLSKSIAVKKTTAKSSLEIKSSREEIQILYEKHSNYSICEGEKFHKVKCLEFRREMESDKEKEIKSILENIPSTSLGQLILSKKLNKAADGHYCRRDRNERFCSKTDKIYRKSYSLSRSRSKSRNSRSSRRRHKSSPCGRCKHKQCYCKSYISKSRSRSKSWSSSSSDTYYKSYPNSSNGSDSGRSRHSNHSASRRRSRHTKKRDSERMNTRPNNDQVYFRLPSRFERPVGSLHVHANADRRDYKVVYIAEINEHTTEQDLYQRFNEFGTITNIKILKRRIQDHYAFVTFRTEESAALAIKYANDSNTDPYVLGYGEQNLICGTYYETENNPTDHISGVINFEDLLEREKRRQTQINFF